MIALLMAATLSAAGFIVVYAIDRIGSQTQLLGLALALCLVFLAAALTIVGQRLVVTEDNEEDYPPPGHPEAQQDLVQIVEESGSRITRKRLLTAAGGTAATALGAAIVTPALSLGPWLDTSSLKHSPWRRGLRLIGSDGLPLFADHVAVGTFYTAFPEHANRDDLASSVVVVRLPTADLRLPAERRAWAPQGILAYSKICTHAGCAIALYRKPTFAPEQPRPALVCPCHYSTFDPARGGKVLFGPAGRPLPQLPLTIGNDGIVRAAGDFSGPVGPSWSSVRRGRAT
ncbi:ubiquinol-cytochrome c reductase iron-sulfur subunit [Baekduia soli]|uniref:Cytochrome bc1 complex Rieske iron-sulfur subunit n=1 Tax=Baekduia soli TaxID=496014 RepID=A0A5B8U5K6_9ACTN|nr:ubiquinol-cytochrome c reductase iron-sulfur subunit [Baekduia soli]QEC48221.1 ubiquinol-cytochrome c reductase iron-sulfur subunit [Baekduia soli]